MNLRDAQRLALDPALSMLPPAMDSREARAMLLAIGLQESAFEHRRQINGPARGFWQFESRGGVAGVLEHSHTREYAIISAQRLNYAPTVGEVYEAIEHNDTLAAVFARLLLWTLPGRLSGADAGDRAWRDYLEAWRPGRPHRDRWNDSFDSAWRSLA